MILSFWYFIPLLILLALSAVQNYRNGIFIVLATVPLYSARVVLFGIPSTWLELAIYVLACVFFITHFLRRDLKKTARELRLCVKKSRLLIPIAVFFIGIIIGVFVAEDKRSALGIFKGWVFDPFLFFLLFIYAIKTKRELFQSIVAVSIGPLIVSLYGFWEIANKAFLSDPARLDSIFVSANHFTLYTVPLAVLMLGAIVYVFFIPKEKWRKYFTWYESAVLSCALAATVAAVYLSNSYGGWITLLGAGFVLWLFLPRSKLKYAILGIGLAVALPIFGMAYKKTGFRHVDEFWKGKNDSVSARIIIWDGAFALIKQNPILGVGLGQFQEAYVGYVEGLEEAPIERDVPFPHSLYLTLWLEATLVGLIGFILMMIVFYWRGLSVFLGKKKSNFNFLEREKGRFLLALPLSAMSAILIHGLVDTTYFKNDLSFVFWFIAGLELAIAGNICGADSG